MIQSSQLTFKKGQNILEVVVVLDETIHEMRMKMLDAVTLKLEFDKAHDKVKWSFTIKIKNGSLFYLFGVSGLFKL